jgi:uncharacterized protein YqeY
VLDKLNSELKQAMKNRDELRTSVLRMLISDFKYAQIEKRSPLNEEESVQVVQRAIKKRKESIEMYEKGGRPELAAKESEELKVLQSFVPAQLDEAQVRQIVQDTLQELGVTDKKDLGRVMKEILSKYKSQIDGKLVQKLVSEKLNG